MAQAAGCLMDALRQRAAQLAPMARITWVAPARLHITVRFIGEADDARATAICAALSPPLHVQPFDVCVAGTGTFPTRGRPRVLWAGFTAGREGLAALEREVASRLDPLLGPNDTTRYDPHLTLARVKDGAGLSAQRLLSGFAEPVLGTVRVEAITLFESQLASSGPTYVPLLHTPLHTSV